MFAFLALADGVGDGVFFDELVGLLDGLFGKLAQGIVDRNGEAAAGAPVEDFAVGNVLACHFFQAEGLGAELDLVVMPLGFTAVFVLDGNDEG